MSVKENDYTCGTCRYHDQCQQAREKFELYDDTCDDWTDENEITEEDIEAQRTDAAEKENHRKEVED